MYDSAGPVHLAADNIGTARAPFEPPLHQALHPAPTFAEVARVVGGVRAFEPHHGPPFEQHSAEVERLANPLHGSLVAAMRCGGAAQ